MNETKYFHSLDLFRGFCGYGVAITHFNAFAFKNVYMEYMSLLFAEFFFVLSGFVLFPQLKKVYDNSKNIIKSLDANKINSITITDSETICGASPRNFFLEKNFDGPGASI